MITGVFNSCLDLGQIFGLMREKKISREISYQFHAKVEANKNGI